MKDALEASKSRMGKLNNAIVMVLDKSNTTPLETIAVLRLLLTRLERAFEVSVMPKRIKRE